LKLKALLAMANATSQKAQADDAVTNDHDGYATLQELGS
jgi:hypothetical protein